MTAPSIHILHETWGKMRSSHINERIYELIDIASEWSIDHK